MTLSPGDRVDRYVIERVLGQGGMGQVFVALDSKLDRRVALKVLAIPVDADDGSQPWAQRLVREARAAASFNHPNVVAVYDVGEHEGQPYIAMELVLGDSLRRHVGKADADQIAVRVGWLADVAKGLAAAHLEGIVHRDIKPDNVMLTRDGVIKIVDFGIARRNVKSADASEPTAVSETLTQAGALVGTVRYMAPEQMRGQKIDGRVDQFAWAVMAYELLAGTHPWPGDDFLALAAEMLSGRPTPLGARAEQVPTNVAQAIDRALSADPNDRFATMTDLVAALGQGSGSPPIAVSDSAATQADTARGGGAATDPTRPALHWYALAFALGLGLLWAVGYGGAIRWNVPQWFRYGGYSVFGVVAVTAIALACLPSLSRRARARPGFGPLALMAALAPVVPGLLGASSGWWLVTGTIDDLGPGLGFEVLHAGYFEIGINTFVGLGVGAALCLGLMVLLGTTAVDRRSPWTWAAGALSIVGIVTAAIGYASAALVLVPTSAALFLLAGWTRRPTSLSRERTLAAISAVLCARGASQTRADACAASVWFEDTTRAERVAAVLSSANDRRIATMAQIVSIALVAVVGLLVVRRARQAGLLQGEAQGTRRFFASVQAGLALLLLIPLVTHERDFDARREALGATLREQFVFFSKLDPPGLEGRPLLVPVAAPAIQITADTIALNGRAIGKLTALDTETGRQAVAATLVTGLAAPARAPEDSPHEPSRSVDLALLVDRRVPWSRALQVLHLAYEGGARSADLLLTRGVEPKVPAGAPPEAGHLLPRDFGALPLLLGKEGFRPVATATFADVTTELLSMPGAGERPIPIAADAAR